MNFDFSEDQKLLKEQVSRFLADNCPIEIVREVLESDDFYSEKVWKGLIDLGLTGTTIPEEYGGLGLSPLELCVIAEELGRASAPVPFSSSVFPSLSIKLISIPTIEPSSILSSIIPSLVILFGADILTIE